jgi:hypothetical protein
VFSIACGADRFGELGVERVAELAQVQVAVDAAVLLPASIMPAAHQRSAICPSRQFLTLREWSR